MQTEPSYFRRYFYLLGKSPLHQTLGDFGYYALTVMDVNHELWALRTWKWIDSEMETLEALNYVFKDSILPGKPLPAACDSKLASIEALLQYAISYHAEISSLRYPKALVSTTYTTTEISTEIRSSI